MYTYSKATRHWLWKRKKPNLIDLASSESSNERLPSIPETPVLSKAEMKTALKDVCSPEGIQIYGQICEDAYPANERTQPYQYTHTYPPDVARQKKLPVSAHDWMETLILASESDKQPFGVPAIKFGDMPLRHILMIGSHDAQSYPSGFRQKCQDDPSKPTRKCLQTVSGKYFKSGFTRFKTYVAEKNEYGTHHAFRNGRLDSLIDSP